MIVTKEPGVFPVNSTSVGYHLLYLARYIRVSQGKHAHLHKYAVKHTLVAPGCWWWWWWEWSLSRIPDHLPPRMLCKREKKKSKQNIDQWKPLSEKLNMFGPNDILQVRKSAFIRLWHVGASAVAWQQSVQRRVKCSVVLLCLYSLKSFRSGQRLENWLIIISNFRNVYISVKGPFWPWIFNFWKISQTSNQHCNKEPTYVLYTFFTASLFLITMTLFTVNLSEVVGTYNPHENQFKHTLILCIFLCKKKKNSIKVENNRL